MIIYKDKQFLIFDYGDGKTVKYDFATKKCIGKSGSYVKDLRYQLRGLSLDDIISNCREKEYASFLKFVKNREYGISNIGTILDRIHFYSNFEQLFTAGLGNVISPNFSYKINDIPNALRKICIKYNAKLTDDFLNYFTQNPDAYVLAYSLDYISLNCNDLYDILIFNQSVSVKNESGCTIDRKTIPIFNTLIKEYGYTAKSLLIYLDYLKTYEAIDDIRYLLREIWDYANISKEISDKFEKYPRHFLTTHRIACRNYNRLKAQFKESEFKKRIDKTMEKSFGEYQFIYPQSVQEIKDEAVAMNNCVASYIQDVIDGDCDILFLRLKSNLQKSLVTIEVRENKIVQAKQKFNEPITQEQQEVVNRWNSWRCKQI